MEFEINVAEIRAEMGRQAWKIKDLAEIWQVNRNTAATYLNVPEKIPYTQMLLLAKAANWDLVKMAQIFFHPKRPKKKF